MARARLTIGYAAARAVVGEAATTGTQAASAADYRLPPASGIVTGMTGNLAASLRNSRIGLPAAMLLCFAAPFVWALSTVLVWELGKRVQGSASDTSISFPSGIALVSIVLAAWLVGWWLSRRVAGSTLARTLWADTVAVAAFCVCFTWQFGGGEWHPAPVPGLTNIFPYRFAFAVALAYAVSAAGAVLLSRRAD